MDLGNKKKYWVLIPIISLLIIIFMISRNLKSSLISSSEKEITSTPLIIDYTPIRLRVGDGGLLSNDPCGPPCFWGMIPGITTKSEVIQIIEERDLMGTCLFTGSNGDGIVCSAGFSIAIHEDKGTVSEIIFKPSVTIRLEDLVSEYGPPDRIFVWKYEEGEKPWDFIPFIFYNKFFMRIELATKKAEWVYAVNSTTPIARIIYFEEEDYYNDILYVFSNEWQGYGEYEGEFFPDL